MVIGITGTNSSGKDTVAKFFIEKGFDSFSLSDILREEAKKRGIEENRDNLQGIGNELREKFGTGYLAQETLKKIKRDAIVTSIRHSDEVKTLKQAQNFFLIAIDAPIELRYKRARKRQGTQDAIDFETFQKQEAKEFQKSGSGQQLGKCMEMAGYKIENNGTKEEFYKKLENLFKSIENEEN